MNKDYQRIKHAIHYLEENFADQPGLDQLSEAIHVSPYHLQRLFKRWAGVSPKQFLQCVTVKHTNRMLQNGSTMLDASEQVGLSSSSRLHDLYINLHAMSPAQYRNRGQGLVINYGAHESPFGVVVIGVADKGICSLFFTQSTAVKQAHQQLLQRWPNADLVWRPQHTRPLVNSLFNNAKDNENQINLYVGGTNFQIKVWQALLQIPFGQVRYYGQIAQAIKSGGASRAVGTAVKNNPIALLIPCHRVIRSTGIIGEYHWGTDRKKAILTWEQCRLSA